MVAITDEYEVQLSVSYRGKQYPINLPADASLEALGVALQRETDAAFETIKLVVPGRKGPPVRPAANPGQSLEAAGVRAKGRLMMLASSAAEVAGVQKAHDLPGLAGFDHELKQAMRRRRQAGGAGRALPTGEYVFQQFQALPHERLTPPPSEALKLLHRLAADPGIVGIMNKHRWKVGLLSEMPPEGKVGVSAMCILGYNINAGQEISLRLRTDDLKGFRRYDRIRETLCHELAHMVWGEHDTNFKQLNSQLLREAAEFEATATGGRTLAGAAFMSDDQYMADWVDEDDVMAVTARSSGKTLRTLGGSAASPPPAARDPRTAAALATLQRMGQAGQQQQPSAQPTPPSMPNARPASPFQHDQEHGEQGLRSPPADRPGGGASWAGVDEEPIEGLGHREDSTEALEDALRMLGDPAVPDSMTVESGHAEAMQASPDTSALEGTQQAQAVSRSAAADREPAQPQPVGAGPDSSGVRGTEAMVVDSGSSLHATASTASPPASPMGASAQHVTAAAPGLSVPALAAAPTHAPPQGAGGADEPATASPAASQPEPTAAAAASTAPPTAEASDPAAERYQGVEAALQKLHAQAGPDAKQALQTLATILQNALNHPEEAKYRRVRLNNAAFHAHAGRFAAALDVLRLAGFAPDSGAEPSLVLRRNDPGLLWLALAAVNAGVSVGQS